VGIVLADLIDTDDVVECKVHVSNQKTPKDGYKLADPP